MGPQAIKPLLAKLSLACRANQGEEIDLKARAALYVEYLSDLPAKYLAEAISEWIRENVFFPAISELRDIAERKAAHARRCLADLREAEAKRKRDAEEAKIPRLTAEQIAEIKARVAAQYPSRRTSRN